MKTGMPACSANCRSSACAPDHRTPLPATIAGRAAARSSVPICSTAAAVGAGQSPTPTFPVGGKESALTAANKVDRDI